MKIRHIVPLILVAGALASTIVGCSLNAVSISQRISQFQSDLNSQDRTSAYLNFHPTLTLSYTALASGTTITTYFPLVNGGTQYSLAITDQNSPSSGVRVTVNPGPVAFGPTPQYLNLVMATTNNDDWRIVSLALSNTYGSYPTIQIQ